mgnify:FL=1
MRTRTRMRLYVAADETAGDARHYAEKAGKWLEKELLVDDADGLGEAVQRVQDALGEHLAKLARELSKVEEQEYTERFRARTLRKRREEQVAELSGRLVMARGVMTHLYGRSEAVRYFGKGKTPRQPVRLVQLADRVIDRLRRAEPLPASGPKVPGSVLSTEAMAAHVEEMARKLEATLEDLAQRELGAGMYLLQKNQVEAKLELAQQDVARVLGGLYRLGGRERLDERVKKNHRKRRPRRRQKVETAERASAARVKAARSAEGASAKRGTVARSAGTASVKRGKLATSPEEVSMTASQALTSPECRSLTSSQVLTSGECLSLTSSQPRTSAECPVPEPSKVPTSPECRSSGCCEELTSRPEAVSKSSAFGEPGGNVVSEPNAHGLGALHPVRRRRANGVTASHPVPERGANGETAAPPVPGREAHDVAA